MLDLVAIGRAGVDLYSLDYGVPLEQAKRFAKYVGGTAANTVVGGSRLGLKCALVTRVSDDELGEFVLNFLKSEGVDTSHIKKDPMRKTGLVFAEILPGKDGRFIFYRENAADLFVTEKDVSSGLLQETRSLLITGTGLSSEPSLSTLLSSARSAREYRKTVILNLDWRPSLWKTGQEERIERFERAMKLADIIIGNDKEYMAATGADDLNSALSVLPDSKEKMIVITRGKEGSEVIFRENVYHAEGFSVPLLKGLGAGDGFIAGFLFGHLNGWMPREAAVFGNAVGAIVVTGHSCSESMPSLRRVVSFLRRRGYSFSLKSGPFKS